MRKNITRVIVTGCLVAALAGADSGPRAQEADGEVKLGWSNSTDVSVVAKEGNARVHTIGFKNMLRRHWKRSDFRLRLEGMQSNQADDRYLIVDPGLTWEPGAEPPPFTTSVVKPGIEPDVERYFVEGKYDRMITERIFWSAGGSWDRNEDAGILHRYIGFGGIGHEWIRKEGHKFKTAYGLSYTDRQEDEVDPEKDDRFGGVRFTWDYLNKFGEVTVYTSVFTANISMEDTSDYSLDMTNAIAVNMSHHLALKVGLQWLFENEPALEDVDIIALTLLVDPDGIPGNGDEYFETVESGGFEITVGEEDLRKEQLDTIFTASLVINF
jgi:putative salt-induced outer membrane protein YdiY